MYDTITNYNDQNYTPLFKANIRTAIDKLVLEDQAESNNGTVDMFSPQINGSEDMIEKLANLIINEVRNDLIKKSRIWQ